jgi:hypothetical protein
VFCAVETDTDLVDDWHGTHGPTPTSRLGLGELGDTRGHATESA